MPQESFTGIAQIKITPEAAKIYWSEHIHNMDQGIEEALAQVNHPQSIGIVGAGEAKDFSLEKLAQVPSIKQIDLIDKDAAAVARAILRTKQDIHHKISHLHLVADKGETIQSKKIQYLDLEITFFLEEFKAQLENLIEENLDKYEAGLRYADLDQEKINEIIHPIIKLLQKCLENRELPRDLPKYDVVVSDNILSPIIQTILDLLEYYLEAIFNPDEFSALEKPSPQSKRNKNEFWKMLIAEIAQIIIPDHIKILEKMLKQNGRIFIASDQHIVKMSQIISRQDFLDGDLSEIVTRYCPELAIEKNWHWMWNLHPQEINPQKLMTCDNQGLILRKSS